MQYQRALRRASLLVATALSVGTVAIPSAASAATVRLEAEGLTLSNYVRKSAGFASGGAYVEVPTGTGSAKTVFAGAAGAYDVVVTYFDETDGKSTLTLKVNGATVGTKALTSTAGDGAPGAHTRQSHRFAGVSLSAGAVVEIVGAKNGGEFARLDYLEIVPAGGVSTPPPSNPPPTATRLEAEGLTLSNYVRKSAGFASGGAYVEVPTGTGSAKTVFAGAAGAYDVVVTYFDETDGKSTLTLKVNGATVGTKALTSTAGDGAPGAHTRQSHRFAGVSLSAGAVVEIVGAKNGGEFARLDYLEIVPAGGVSTPPPSNPPPTNPPPSDPPSNPPPSGGSSGVGPGETPPIPSNAVHVSPGTNIQALINGRSGGTTYFLKSGVHRLQGIVPKTGDTFLGEKGAVLSGARRLTTWAREGNLWVASGQTQQNASGNTGACKPDFPRCHHPEDLFLDDQPLKHVASKGAVTGPGKWYFDYGADKVYMHDNPSGRTVEVGVTPKAFSGPAANVTIKNLTVEKYATPLQNGAIDTTQGANWRIENNTIRLNHGLGILLGERGRAVGNRVLWTGTQGIGAIGAGGLFERNEVAFSNFAGMRPGWSGGASKFANTTNLTVRCNWVHDNWGHGLWTDVRNKGTLYERNLVVNNTDAGIFHEISYDAVIRNNVVKGNGRAFSAWVWGAQIQIATSENVRVEGNVVEVPADKGNGIAVNQQTRGSWKGRNTTVTGNTVIHLGARGQNGAATDVSSSSERDAFYASTRFEGNTYVVPDPTQAYWTFRDGSRTWSAFRSFGHEKNGTVKGPGTRDNTPNAVPNCS